MTGKEFFSMRQWPFIIQNQCDILKTNVTFSNSNVTYPKITRICVESDSPIGVSTQLKSSGLVAHENSTFRNLAIGVSTQLQSSGLVAHENSTFRNLALAVSGPFMA